MKWLFALIVLFLIGCSAPQATEPIVSAPEPIGTEPVTPESTPPAATETAITATPAVAEPATPPEDVVVFNITAKNFFWNPPTIRVQQGDKVRLHLTSADIFHGFAIKEYDIDVPVQAGETETVEFVASKKGNFTFYCSVYCGSGHGRMKGVLVVE